MNSVEAESIVRAHPGWHHNFEIFPGVSTNGSYDPGFMVEKLDLATDLSGLRILDVGASDGYFSLMLHKRGADVTAVDFRHKSDTGFSIMEKLNNVEIKHLQCNVYNLPTNIGKYDIVLFLGVIYHLPDIPSALWRLSNLCKHRLILESYVEVFESNVPMARYYEADSLDGDVTNFWAPNVACMQAMMRDCGFSIVKSDTWGDRAMVLGEVGGSVGYKMHVAYSQKLGA